MKNDLSNLSDDDIRKLKDIMDSMNSLGGCIREPTLSEKIKI